MAGKVCVACKLPNGLFLQLFTMVTGAEPVMGGGFREVKIAQRVGEQIRINGYAHPAMSAPRAPMSQGFALTEGIDADFWEAWLNQNRDADYVRNGLIFAHATREDVKAQTREHRAISDNQGPIVPNTDPRIPKKKNVEGKEVPAIIDQDE